MPEYLPLCAFRQDLLPAVCRTCAWWQTSGIERVCHNAARARRQQWMAALEPVWGSVGLIRTDSLTPCTPSVSPVVGSIHFAPASSMPRLRDLPLGPLPADAVLLFCLRVEGTSSRALGRRLLHKAIEQLKERHLREVYALAALSGGWGEADRCEFFSIDFLGANGFEQIRDNGEIFLMRADLRGLLSLVAQVQTAIKRVLRSDPTPSPAAWTRREAP